MIRAQFLYNVILTYDIDSEHNAILRKRLIEDYGFKETIEGFNDKGEKSIGKLPESTLYKSLSTLKDCLDMFTKICKDLGVKEKNVIAIRCDEWCGQIETDM